MQVTTKKGSKNISEKSGSVKKRGSDRGAWVAQSVKHPTSAQVIISRFVGLSPTSGSVQTAQSLRPVWDSVSPSLCLSPTCALSLSISKNKYTLKQKQKQSEIP